MIRRDFETKAPSGTEILQRIEAGGHYSRPLRADARRRAEPVLGQPVRHDHVRQACRPGGGTCRATATTCSCRCSRPGRTRSARSPPSSELFAALPAGLGRRGRGPDLAGAVRRAAAPASFHATELPAVKPTVAEILDRPEQPHLLPGVLRPRLPGLRLPATSSTAGGGRRAGGAAPVGDGAAQPVPVGPRPTPADRPSASCATTTTSWSSSPADREVARLHLDEVTQRRRRQRVARHSGAVVRAGGRGQASRSGPTRPSTCGSGSGAAEDRGAGRGARARACAPTTISSATPPTAGRR